MGFSFEELDVYPEPDDPYWGKRRPFLYFPESQHIVMGEHGSHHGYLEDELRMQNRSPSWHEPVHKGMIWTEPTGRSDRANVMFWNRPGNEQEVREAVLNAYPHYRWQSEAPSSQPETHDYDDDLWKEASEEIKVTPLAGPQMRGDHGDSHPFFYDPNTNEVIVGPKGYFHLDMLAGHPDPERKEYYRARYLDRVNDPEFGWAGRMQPDEAVWYDSFIDPRNQYEAKIPEETRQKVNQAVRDHLGYTDAIPNSSDDLWNDSLWNEDVALPPTQARWVAQPTWRQAFAQAHGVNVIQCTNEQHDWIQENNPEFGKRIPFRYDPVKGNVFVGHPHYFHMNVGTSPEFDNEARPRVLDGYIWTHTKHIDWYNKPHERDQQLVSDALADHLGYSELIPMAEERYDHEFWENL